MRWFRESLSSHNQFVSRVQASIENAFSAISVAFSTIMLMIYVFPMKITAQASHALGQTGINTPDDTDDAMNIGDSADSSESLSEATIYEILSNRRRRYTVHLLKRSDTVDVTELSRQITTWERDIPREEVSYKDQKSVYTALRDTHLPLLVDHDLIRYDEEANVVEATSGLSALEVYVEALGATEIPWGYYYLGIASISVLLFAAVVVGVPGLATVGPLGVSVFTIAAFGVSGGVHYYYGNRSRLGNLEHPPEVRKRG